MLIRLTTPKQSDLAPTDDAAAPRSSVCVDDKPRSYDISPADRALLMELRRTLSRSRLVGALEGEGKASERGSAADGAGLAFFQALSEASERRLLFFCEQCPLASVDEMWLMRLVRATQGNDWTNVQALMGFRIKKMWRRRLYALLRRFADAL